MRADELDRIAAKNRIKGLFIMPSTANPTGTTLSEKRKDEISAVAKARSLTVIEDDISPFPPSPQRRSFFSRLPDSTIYIAAYTAMLAPGFRITFAAFPEPFRERLMKGLYLLNIKAGSLDAEVISELILSGTAQRIMAAKREAARKANDIFDAAFPKFALGKNARRNGLFPFFRRIRLPPSDLSGPETENFFRDRGVSVMHSCRFAVGKAIQQDFLRISISAMPTSRQLKTALGKLASALADFHS
jgi:DNA-binding transcriptional MocR family regulator